MHQGAFGLEHCFTTRSFCNGVLFFKRLRAYEHFGAHLLFNRYNEQWFDKGKLPFDNLYAFLIVQPLMLSSHFQRWSVCSKILLIHYNDMISVSF